MTQGEDPKPRSNRRWLIVLIVMLLWILGVLLFIADQNPIRAARDYMTQPIARNWQAWLVLNAIFLYGFLAGGRQLWRYWQGFGWRRDPEFERSFRALLERPQDRRIKYNPAYPFRNLPRGVLFLAVLLIPINLIILQGWLNGRALFELDETGAILWMIVIGAYVLAFAMTLSRRMTTHGGRRVIDFIFLILLICAAGITSLMSLQVMQSRQISASWLMPLIYLLTTFISFSAVRAYAMPCNGWSAIPLFLSLLAWPFPMLFYFAMSGLWFPTYRRMKMYWQPTRLPHLPTPRGLTLIELLIVVAIAAISVAGLAHVVMATHQLAQRGREWSEAMQLIEDEFTLLRAQGGVPAQGEPPALAAALQAHPLAGAARVELAAGPAPDLREVRVSVRIGEAGQERDVVLARVMRTIGSAP